jgi:DNA-binding transcriptional LysR family regulator
MTLQQLRYFLASLEKGSFSAAAEEMHIAQPSISEQVRRLEAELGVALFQRVGRGLVPTEAGHVLRDHAERVIAAADEARESLSAVRELKGGTASFGTFGTARHYLGTGLIDDFRIRYPHVKVRLVGQNSSEVAEAVRGGELEAGLVALPIDDRGLEVRPTFRDEVLVASTSARRLKGRMTIEKLAEMPLILSEARWGAQDPTRRQLTELAQRVGVTLEPEIDVEDIEVAIELAVRGHGDVIVGRSVLGSLGDHISPRLGWKPFDEPIYDTFAFISRRGAQLSPATREFMGLAERRLSVHARELSQDPPRQRAAGG